MDPNDDKDEGIPSSPEDDPNDSDDQSHESRASLTLSPSATGPSRSRSGGKSGRNPYTVVSPRKWRPGGYGAGSCASGSSMPPVAGSSQRLAGFSNVAGGPGLMFRGAGAASNERHTNLHPSISSELRSQPDPNRRRRHPAGGNYPPRHGESAASRLQEMLQGIEQLNISPEITSQNICRNPVQNNPQPQQGASGENLRGASRTLLLLLREIHSTYASPMSESNPSVRQHRTLVRLLERVSSQLRTVGELTEGVVRMQAMDADVFALISSRIPEVISEIQQAVIQYHTPDVNHDHGEILRSILAKVLPDLFTLAEQIREAA